MIYHTRKLVKPGDLNPENTLFGGRLLSWVDEECAIFAICQLNTRRLRTKVIGEINFLAPAHQGDVIEIGVHVVKFGTTSINMKAEVRNKNTGEAILTLDKIIMVSVDENGNKTPHGITGARKVWQQFTQDPYPFKDRPSTGVLLSHYCDKKGLTLTELAKKAGLDNEDLDSLINPNKMGDNEIFSKLGAVTDIEPACWLLAEFEYRKQQATKACNHAAGITD